MEYTLNRSRRRTLALYIRDGGVEVRAPMKMPKQDIDRFVASKDKWIKARLEKSRIQAERRETFSLYYNDTILFRGEPHQIVAKNSRHAGIDGECFYMPPALSPDLIKSTCVRIYRDAAKNYLTERTFDIARIMSAKPAGVRISGAKTRWGSCSAKKNISYSWRLMMAGDEVIDYVIVHELAHLAQMNHSARFWRIVATVLPDYALRKARLKELQKKLGDEDWG